MKTAVIGFGGQGRTMAAIGMFWRAMACSPPLPAKTRHSAKSLAGDGGRCRVLAGNGV